MKELLNINEQIDFFLELHELKIDADMTNTSIWKYIMFYNVKTIVAHSLTPKKAILLAKILQDTNVTSLDLKYSILDKYSPEFAKNLQGTNVTFLDIKYIKLKEYAPEFAINLKHTKVTSLELFNNKIGEHYLAFIQNLKESNITSLKMTSDGNTDKTLKLIENYIPKNIHNSSYFFNDINTTLHDDLGKNPENFFHSIYTLSNITHIKFEKNGVQKDTIDMLFNYNFLTHYGERWIAQNSQVEDNKLDILVEGFLKDIDDVEIPLDIVGLVTEFSMNPCIID